MSRIIVKNLPKSISVEKLKAHFSKKGEVTDVQPKYTNDGKFRQFAFIGFRNELDAANALEYFDNTFVDSSRIKVELCEVLGSTSVKPWSKYTKQKLEAHETFKSKEGKRDTCTKSQVNDDIESDPKFTEFLEVQKKTGEKSLWSNDGGLIPKDNSQTFESSDSESEEVSESSEEENEEDDEDVTEPKTVIQATIQKGKKKTFTVKVKGLPRKIKRKDVQNFFHPLKYLSLRIPKKCQDIAFIEFKDEKSMNKALVKHRGFLNGQRIRVLRYSLDRDNVVEDKWANKSEMIEGDQEAIIETGRIFVRNLTYTCKEEDLEELFKKFGPLSEVHLPIDTFTKKIKGFAFVSFMFPEHAVKAFAQLDGSSFQGRTLHLIPSRVKKEETMDGDDLNYKKKKEAQLKSQSGSSHTWNSLFLGANAVANVMAEKYKTTKAKLLEPESKESIAVRMALGETQIVSETKEYLLQQGVHLNAFQTPGSQRSKNVIIVKNLPASTKPTDIENLFKKHGDVKRVIMPPSGIAAIVEFEHNTEAKSAFRKLAYSKFEHVPLYLEWAPLNVFIEPKEREESKENEEVVSGEDNNKLPVPTDDTEQAEEPETEATLFVKNLRFETEEEELKSHFESMGKVVNATIAKKKDMKHPGQWLSMGYGFIQFSKKSSALKALKEMQHSSLQGHALELKISNKHTAAENAKPRKTVNDTNGESTKVLVRNIPFEASQKEVRELFKVFGELKSVRLPQKMSGAGQHRGFGFVDFLTQQDAKRAMDSLSQSTHLYGRRLVLEWAETDDKDVETLRRKTSDTFHSGVSKSKKLKQMIEEKL